MSDEQMVERMRRALTEQRAQLRQEIDEQGADPDGDEVSFVDDRVSPTDRTAPRSGPASSPSWKRCAATWPTSSDRARPDRGRYVRFVRAVRQTHRPGSDSKRGRGRWCASTASRRNAVERAAGSEGVARRLRLVGRGRRAGRRRVRRCRRRHAGEHGACGGRRTRAEPRGARDSGTSPRSKGCRRVPTRAPPTGAPPSVRPGRTPRPGTGR